MSPVWDRRPRQCLMRVVTALFVALVCLGACSTAEPAPGDTGGAEPSPSSKRVDQSDPGSVAVAYTTDFAAGNYDAAKTLLNPAQHGILEAIALGARGQPGTTAHGELAAGRRDVDGDTGIVSLIGKLCRGTGPASSPNAPPECIENSDPDTESPLFLVHLIKLDGRWFVTYPVPPVTGETSTPG